MDDHRVSPRVPSLAWLLVAAAVVQLIALVAQHWYRVFGPYLILRFDDLVAAIWGVGPYLIAAAAVVAAPRWGNGRRWIVAGAVVIGLQSIIGGLMAAWWAWFPPVEAPSRPEQAFLVSLNLVSALTSVAGPLFLAIGIHRGGFAAGQPSAVRAGAMVAVGIGVIVAIALSLRLLGAEVAWLAERPAESEPWLAAVTLVARGLMTLHVVAYGLLAMAALRTAFTRSPWPELAIAAGAALVPAWSAAGWYFQWLTLEHGPDRYLDLPYQLVHAFGALGILLLLAGFVTAALHPRHSTEG